MIPIPVGAAIHPQSLHIQTEVGGCGGGRGGREWVNERYVHCKHEIHCSSVAMIFSR